MKALMGLEHTCPMNKSAALGFATCILVNQVVCLMDDLNLILEVSLRYTLFHIERPFFHPSPNMFLPSSILRSVNVHAYYADVRPRGQE